MTYKRKLTITQIINNSVMNVSNGSEKLLEFMSKKVTKDYEVMIDIAKKYEGDTVIFNEMASNLGLSSADMLLQMKEENHIPRDSYVQATKIDYGFFLLLDIQKDGFV